MAASFSVFRLNGCNPRNRPGRLRSNCGMRNSRLLMQVNLGLLGAENILLGHPFFFRNAPTEVNPRIPLPGDDALAHAIGWHRLVSCCADDTGGMVVCPDDEQRDVRP